eukprot:SAG22_NODE_817_length_7026_cov_13.636206_3_plen_274_part_00
MSNLPGFLFEDFRYRGSGSSAPPAVVPESPGFSNISDDALAAIDLTSIETSAAAPSAPASAAAAAAGPSKPKSRTVKLKREPSAPPSGSLLKSSSGSNSSFAASPVESPGLEESPLVVRKATKRPGKKRTISSDEDEDDDDDEDDEDDAPLDNLKRARCDGSGGSGSDDAELAEAIRRSKEESTREQRDLQRAIEASTGSAYFGGDSGLPAGTAEPDTLNSAGFGDGGGGGGGAGDTGWRKKGAPTSGTAAAPASRAAGAFLRRSAGSFHDRR